MKRTACLIYALMLGACQTTGDSNELVQICDSSGCSMRPASTETFVPSETAENHEQDAHVAALESLARDDARAAYDLGLRYFRGDGVLQNSFEALQWMRHAGERGDLQAQKALGRFYMTGLEEMGPDLREAQRWLGMAASRGDSESQELLQNVNRALQDEYYYRQRLRIWRDYSYYYWYRAYPYRWYWRRGYWVYRY